MDKDSLFNSLFKRYRDKNYPMASLKIRKNLFEQTSLLMKKNQIIGFYKSNLDEAHQLDKDLGYLRVVQHGVSSKVTEEENKLFKFHTAHNSPVRVKKSAMDINKTLGEMEKEIEGNRKENSKLKESIRHHMKSKGCRRSGSMVFDEQRIQKVIFNLDNIAQPKSGGAVTMTHIPAIRQYRHTSTILDGASKSGNNKLLSRSATKKDFSSSMKFNSKSASKVASTGVPSKNQSSVSIFSIHDGDSGLDASIMRSPVRKNAVYMSDSKGQILNKLYNQISSKKNINSETRDEIAKYLTTFTGFFNK
jgi:hypothetical protein